MTYLRESFFEDNAEEVARWAIYLARNKQPGIERDVAERFPGQRGEDAQGRGGALMEVRADRCIVPEGDFYRVRARRIASLDVTGRRPISVSRLLSSRESSRHPLPWTKWGAAFQVTVNHEEKEVRFGPTGQLGNLREEDKGIGLGLYCLAKVIGWAAERYPSYKVAAGSLSGADARTGLRRDRRNAFYEGAGFVVEYSDSDRKNGVFYASQVSDLTSRWRRGRVREVSLYGLVGAFARATDDRKRCSDRLQSCRGHADRLRAANRKLLRVAVLSAGLALTGVLFLLLGQS